MDEEIRAFLASLEAQPSYTLSTRLAYGSDLRIFRHFIEKKLGHYPTVSDLTSGLFIEFLETEHRNGLKANTLLRRKAALQRFEAYLRQAGSLQAAIFNAEVPFLRRKQPEDLEDGSLVCLTVEEIGCLKNYFNRLQRPVVCRDRAILSLLLETGMSVSALIALNLSEVDLPTRRFYLSPGVGRDCWLPLDSAIETLERYILDARPELNPAPDEQALFISQLGARMSRQSIWQILRNSGKAIHLSFTLSPRIVRHTAALRLFHSGRSIQEIQLLLGHSNPLSTQALLHRLEETNSKVSENR